MGYYVLWLWFLGTIINLYGGVSGYRFLSKSGDLIVLIWTTAWIMS